MKPEFIFSKSVSLIAGVLTVVFVSSCGSSYQNASVQNDGIYASDAVADKNTSPDNANTKSNSTYYQNYFEEQDQLISQARSQNEVFTDIDNYSSQGEGDVPEEDITTDENASQYSDSYGGWGTQPTSVSINYIDNGFWGPNWGWGRFGFGPGWGWGGGFYGAGWGWGGGLYGPGWGWGGGFFGPGWGWGGFGLWGGFYGPAIGWGGFYGPGWGGFYGSGLAYNNLAFHGNYRARNSYLNRGRSNLALNSQNSRSRLNTNARNSRVNANRGRSNRYANADGRRIRNSSNVNARVRSNRADDRSTTTTRRGRSGYSNQSVYRRSSGNNSVRSNRSTRRYSPRSSSTRSRSTRTRSSSTRSSSRSSSSRSSGSRSGGGRSRRGGGR